ncbi:MAG: DUF998 domain-containing protein [Acidobacteria bacterium]|nr:DUF998 domain-containing protein [Acidobacteriota bacterium]MBI3489765.1 DUF998 domain-containing protein [Acidobacteriota bacterium]
MKPAAQFQDKPGAPATAPGPLQGSAARDFLFLRLGGLIPLVFFGTTAVCGWIHGRYNHLTGMVSELGALGTRSQHVFTAGLLTCALLSVGFNLALLRACRRQKVSPLPVLLLFSFTVSIAGAGLFPLPTRLHLLAGMPASLLVLSPLASLLLWRGGTAPARSGKMAAISLGVMCLGFLSFFPGVLPQSMGLKQRLFHLGWSIWFIHLSLGFRARVPETT